MKIGDLIIKTLIDKTGVEEGLDDIEEEAEEKGEKSSNKFTKGFGKIGNKIKTSLSNAFSKATGISKGLLKVVTSIAGAVAQLGLGMGFVGILIGAIVVGALILAQAFKKVFGENEQLKTDLQYIVFAVQSALEPAVNAVAGVLQKIVAFLIQAVKYAMAFMNLLAGRNLFANASAEKFADSLKKADENAQGTAKSLKDAGKQLAGFDEMNVLQDTSSSGGGSGASSSAGAGITMPSFDLTDLTEYEEKLLEVQSNWQKFGADMKETLDTMPLSDWFVAFGEWGLAIRGVMDIAYGFWEVIEGLIEFVKGVVDFIVGLILGDTDKIQKGIFEMLDGLWKVIDGLIRMIWGVVEGLVGLIVGIVVWLVKQICNVFIAIVDWIYTNITKPITDFFTKLGLSIVTAIKTAIDLAKAKFTIFWNFISGIVSSIIGLFRTIGATVGNVIGGAFKGVINGVLGAIESILNFPIKSINKLINVINKIPGIELGKLSTFSLPRLAKGGIINQPGRGVNYGVANIAEHGAEGIIPLTDSQQMALLGEAIGRYITVNANITNTMNGRVISRELQRVQNDSDFAYNR